MITFGSLFAGIGGLDLGLERAGMTCKWQVEIDDYATRVLAKHWPDVRRWDDVRTWPQPDTERVDLICGGFPCQDISFAGKGRGIDGPKSGLWAEYFRIVCILRPRFVLIENVSAIVTRGLDRILSDLASIGFDAEWQTIRASDFARPHRRERVFIVSYPDQFNESSGLGNCEAGGQEIFATHHEQCAPVWVETTATADRVDHGVSTQLYRRGVGGLGNAVVPQVAEWIGRRIVDALDQQSSNED